MLQVAAAGLHGRDLRDAFRRAEGKQGRVRSTAECDSQLLAEDTRRPAFSTPRFCARRPTTKSRDSSQGSARLPAGKSRGARQIEERGQQVFVAHFAGVGELRNRQKLHVGGRERVGVRADFRVGGAELVVPRSIPMTYFGAAAFSYSISISAGAIIVASCFAGRFGRSTLVARQPLWRSVPPAGGWAGTLPTNFTRFGSCAGALA